MTSDNEGGGRGERIVVGVDGSPDARRALEWAFSHAGSQDNIDIVHSWQQPIMASEAGHVCPLVIVPAPKPGEP